jgi:hypothetical protein
MPFFDDLMSGIINQTGRARQGVPTAEKLIQARQELGGQVNDEDAFNEKVREVGGRLGTEQLGPGIAKGGLILRALLEGKVDDRTRAGFEGVRQGVENNPLQSLPGGVGLTTNMILKTLGGRDATVKGAIEKGQDFLRDALGFANVDDEIPSAITGVRG